MKWRAGDKARDQGDAAGGAPRRGASGKTRGAPSGVRYNAAVTIRAGAVIVLLLLLVAFPLIGALPDQMASIRLAGLSLLWWYGGVVAPILAWLVAVMGLPDGSPPRRPE
jgi:hypothetical protein